MSEKIKFGANNPTTAAKQQPTRNTKVLSRKNFVKFPELNSALLPDFLTFRIKSDKSLIRFSFGQKTSGDNPVLGSCIKVYNGIVQSFDLGEQTPKFMALSKMVVFDNQISFHYSLHGKSLNIFTCKRSDMYDLQFLDNNGERINQQKQ